MTATPAVNAMASVIASCGFDGDVIPFGGDGGTERWPRQETLTLLEIRSRLDPKFKEANQKGPLWDEVSRVMCEDHGYQRSGKKCREKFENLYKYYKKTKEGKAVRQDGKHYRFFRQLEALYGETSNSISGQETQLVGNNFVFHATQNCNITQANQDVYHSQKLCDSLSLSNSFEFDPSSSDDNGLSTAAAIENGTSSRKKKRGGGSRCWKAKIKEFIDSQIRKLIERQEAWLEKLTYTLEENEKERGVSSSEVVMANEMENQCETLKDTVKVDGSQETEIFRLIQLRTTMEGCSEEILWEEIAAKMACLGFEKSSLMCKEKMG
ncbi:ERF024 protein [Hibiscus syriacus]|uniref:ERF024 protein n=1 Tax=Hibiscus syriacus TaxID=106335 RepID=A0A6A2ZF96_HIBSY|nr:ERF024 protein [Hibiscus syriacus]